MATWEELIGYAMKENGDSINHVVASAPPLATGWYKVEFDNGYGMEQGQPFLLWTTEYVYFPVMYDGAEWAGSAPRNPVDEPQEHLGG